MEACVLDAGVSAGCGSCLGALFGCVAVHCSNECIEQPDEDAGCDVCTAANCTDETTTCFGADPGDGSD